MLKKIVDNNKKLIIFDKNGTLINFMDTWKPWINMSIENINKLLDSKNSKVSCTYDFYRILGYDNMSHQLAFSDRSLMAYKDKYLIRKMISKYFAKKYNKSINEIKNCMNIDERIKECKPICDLKPILNNLQENNFILALLTSDSRLITTNNLLHLDIYDYFDFIKCYDDLNYLKKPNPRNLLEIKNYFNVSFENTYIVGDSRFDIIMGNRAGINTIGVLSGVGNINSFKNNANYIINSVEDLPNILVN